MNITVYLAASPGKDPCVAHAARELGAWIGETGNTLVYGGSKTGLMGVLAQSALDAGGEVIGVEPQFFIDEQLQLDELTELIVVPTMAERRAKMIELGDAFVALPGGNGTLEEMSEIMSMVSLNHTNALCIFFNINGYYDLLKAFLAQMIEYGYSTPQRQDGIYFAESLEEVRALLTGIK